MSILILPFSYQPSPVLVINKMDQAAMTEQVLAIDSYAGALKQSGPK